MYRLRQIAATLLSTIISRTVITKEYMAKNGNQIADLWYFCQTFCFPLVNTLCRLQDILPTLRDTAKNYDAIDEQLYMTYLYCDILVIYCSLPQLQDRTLLTNMVCEFFQLLSLHFRRRDN